MLESPHTFQYVDSDIPAGMTINEYRRTRFAVRRGFLSRLRRSLSGPLSAGVAAA